MGGVTTPPLTCIHNLHIQGSVDENRAAGDEVVSFTVTDGDRSVMASQLEEIELIGADSDFFIAEITSSSSGRILTKYVYIALPVCRCMLNM